MLSESLNDDFWMASGMMERNDARASAPDPPIVYYSVTDESGVTRKLGDQRRAAFSSLAVIV
jgi:hypothetical protein